jgi:hypothetical protein
MYLYVPDLHKRLLSLIKFSWVNSCVSWLKMTNGLGAISVPIIRL